MVQWSPRVATLFALLLGIGLSATVLAEIPSYQPKDGFVPDEKTAVAVAQAILIPIYGQRQIDSEKPFHAKLGSNGVWTVEGSLREDTGGVATVRLQRKDGRIVYVMHGK